MCSFFVVVKSERSFSVCAEGGDSLGVELVVADPSLKLLGIRKRPPGSGDLCYTVYLCSLSCALHSILPDLFVTAFCCRTPAAVLAACLRPPLFLLVADPRPLQRYGWDDARNRQVANVLLPLQPARLVHLVLRVQLGFSVQPPRAGSRVDRRQR